METLATPINEAARSLGIGRTKVYELIADGTLATVRIGRRQLIKADSLRRLVEAA